MSDGGSTTMGLGYLLSNDGSLELVFDGDYCWIHGVNDTDCGLVYDSSSGLLMDYGFENSHGAYCYSNQQTEWASDLASELLSKYGQIINYLKGTNINLDGLNVSTVGLLKSCSGILSIASIFVNFDSEVVVGSLVGLGSLSLDLIFGVVILPVVFFLGMDVVGEPDGYVDNYWKTHNITDSQGISVIEVNQIRTPQEKYYNYVGSSLIKASQNQYKYSLSSNGPENGTNPIEKLGENIRNHLDSAKSEFNNGNYLKALKELGWLNAAGFGISLYIVAENEEVIVKIIERFS